MSKSLLLIAALAASSAHALKVAPAKPCVKLPSSASNALALRGGGVVPQSAWLKAFSGFMGMYALGFVLAPQVVIEQNFDAPYDKYHLFISRVAGISFLTLIYILNTIDIATAVPIALVYAALTALFGPIYAEFKLETKPAHKAALLMIPLLITGYLAL